MPDQAFRVAPKITTCMDNEHSRLFIDVQLPGVKKEDVKATLHSDNLYLTAVREDAGFEYGITYGLCCPVRAEEAKAKYENGLLTIEVPTMEILEGAVNLQLE